MKNVEIYDIEVLHNFFSYCGYNIETKKWSIFYIHKSKNHVKELYIHLKSFNSPLISERIFNGDFGELKDIMGRSRELGMRTFDWALFDLYNEGVIGYEEALRNADSSNELRLSIKLKSPRGEPKGAEESVALSMEGDEPKELTQDELENLRMRELANQRERKVNAERNHIEREYQRNKAAQDARRKKEDEELQRLKVSKPPTLDEVVLEPMEAPPAK